MVMVLATVVLVAGEVMEVVGLVVSGIMFWTLTVIVWELATRPAASMAVALIVWLPLDTEEEVQVEE
jgi:hypothetical protein